MEKPVFNFLEPKKKRFVYGFETGPFPVPIETLTGVQNSGRQWSYYQGRLNGNSVLVESLQEMEALYQMGFFGKGNLSWSSPDYNVAVGKDRRVVKKKSDETFLRLMSRRRYMKHLEWQKYSSPACANESKSDNGKQIRDQTGQKQGLDETQSTSLSSTSCPQSSTSFPQSSTSFPQPSSTTEQECSSGVFEDEDGDTLLVEDSEEDEGDVSIPKKRLKESVARDPFPLRENLQLGLEEAFFLSYGLGCLVVTNGDKGPMNLTEMWEKFQEVSPSFITRYVAYHNFRSKGWVVKTGIKYGVDFVLYKKGLPFYHSSYSVVVIAVNEGSNYEENVNFDWTSLCCTNRVTEQVSKELMFCYVVKPTNLSDEELRSPRCISKFKIAEVIVRRWISKKERENAEYLEMP